MCGIVGAVSNRDIASILLDGLQRLEYRGYDSAGIAILDSNQQLLRYRLRSKVKILQKLISSKPFSGNIGIAHTRWATHGKPSERNAHPHIVSDEIAIVHNGIIENHESLRAHLLTKDVSIASETDSELVAHLIYLNLQAGMDFLTAVRLAKNELKGTFAICILRRSEPDRLIAFRQGSPLVIGLGDKENFIASDQLALMPFSHRFIYLDEGDIADLYADKVTIYDKNEKQIEREICLSEFNSETATKGKYPHFMLKEIYEQPAAIAATLEGPLTNPHALIDVFGMQANEIFKQIRRVELVACGSSFHACLLAKYWLEEITGIPAYAEIASENRYRHKVIEPDTLFVVVSQSGETADTLAALQLAKKSGYLATLAICNVPESSIAREADLVFMTRAGFEIGVASTKAFTSQLAALFLLALALRNQHSPKIYNTTDLLSALEKLPEQIQQALELDPAITAIADTLIDKHHVLFLARGFHLPIVMEGALKLKEISYIHAEAYPAGELKHGSLALIDANMPVIALAPADETITKLKSNLQEILAREGTLIVFADKKAGIANNTQTQIVIMPSIDHLLAPILYTIPLQLLAYHVAVLKNTDVDQPRNLAKSVTVE